MRDWRDSRRDRGGHRWWDEEALRREEAEREGGRQRWEGIIDDRAEYDKRDYGGGYYGRRDNKGDRNRNDDQRFRGGDHSVAAGTEVRFKGRGSMKYTERKW